MKANLLIIALLCLSVVSLTDKEILQQTVNGLFEQNKLPDPTGIVKCFDDKSAHDTVVLIGTILDKAAKGSPSDIKELQDIIQKYSDNLPDSVKTCLSGDESELTNLASKYGITNTTDPKDIEKKFISYVTLHYLTVHKWLGDLDKNWKAGKFYDVGFAAAGYGHQVLNMIPSEDLPELTDRETLQQAFNGLFEQNKLADPTTIVQCFDDASAHSTVVFAGTLLDKAAKGSISDLIGLKDLVQKFGDSLPQAVKDCLSNNAELKTLGLKYGLDDKTDPSVIEKKVISYLTLHYLTVHKWIGDLNNNWKSGKFYQVGFDAASHGHTILGMTSDLPELTDKETLQQAFNGLFEQNKLADPTTIVQCFDDASAHSTVVFVGTLLDKAAKGSISDLIGLKDLVQKFGDSLPKAVKDCLSNDAELKVLGDKYGINNKTDPSVIEKKVISYVTLHYLTVHKWLGDLDSNWKSGKFYQVGYNAGTYGHTILGLTPSPSSPLSIIFSKIKTLFSSIETAIEQSKGK